MDDCFHDILGVWGRPLDLGVDDSIMEEIVGERSEVEHHCDSIEED
jgi:hypothetical protein